MQKILVSACLLGQKVRYNGTDKLLYHSVIQQWHKENRLVSVCPEVAGGLTTPRPPAEIQSNSSVITSEGQDVSQVFRFGAEQALELCLNNNIRFALLKSRSPSCGSEVIYDGSFSGALKSGNGVTAELLKSSGIRVFTEDQVETLIDAIQITD